MVEQNKATGTFVAPTTKELAALALHSMKNFNKVICLSGARSQGSVDVIFKPTTNLDILSKLAKYLSKETDAKKPIPVIHE